MDQSYQTLELFMKLSTDNDRLHHELVLLSQQNARIDERLSKIDGATRAIKVKGEEEGRVFRGGIASIRKELNHLQRSQSTPHECTKHELKPRFTLFPRLPPELRLKIWKNACFNQPRVIVLHVAHSRDECHFYCTGDYIPSVLQTSSESRSESLKWYKKKAVDFGRYEYQPLPGRQSYFNFRSDILYLDMNECWENAFPSETYDWAEIVTKHRTIRQFRRIAIDAIADEFLFAEAWRLTGRSVMKPRSKIDEILYVYEGQNSFQTDQEFCLLPDNIPIALRNRGSFTRNKVRIADKVQEIYRYLAEEPEDEVDSEIEPDDPSSDEDDAAEDEPGMDLTVEEGAETVDRPDSVPRSPRVPITSVTSPKGKSKKSPKSPSQRLPPTVTFAALQERYSPRPTRISMA